MELCDGDDFQATVNPGGEGEEAGVERSAEGRGDEVGDSRVERKAGC